MNKSTHQIRISHAKDDLYTRTTAVYTSDMSKR